MGAKGRLYYLELAREHGYIQDIRTDTIANATATDFRDPDMVHKEASCAPRTRKIEGIKNS